MPPERVIRKMVKITGQAARLCAASGMLASPRSMTGLTRIVMTLVAARGK